MLECDDHDDHDDGDVNTKSVLDPPELIRNTNILQARLTNMKNHNCKGMSLQLNKQLLIQLYI